MKNSDFKRFTKYFAISFAIVSVGAFVAIICEKAAKFVELDLPVDKIIAICGMSVLTIVTALACYALSIAIFLTFWRMNNQNWEEFFRSLLTGLIIIAPLAAGIYYYDWYVSPQVVAVSIKQNLEMRQYNTPKQIEEEYNIPFEEFLADMPIVMSRNRLKHRTDSLKVLYSARIDTCRQMQAYLSDKLVASDHCLVLELLKDSVSTDQHATDSINNRCYVARVIVASKHERALTALMDTQHTLQRYIKQQYDRTINAILLCPVYLLLALTGYLLRYKSLAKIVNVLALLILMIYTFQKFDSYGNTYAEKVKDSISDAIKAQQEKLMEIKKAEKE